VREKKRANTSRAEGDAFVSVFDGIAESEIWLADSGASVHMTRQKNYFIAYKSFSSRKQIQVGNCEKITAYGQGTINVEMNVGGKWHRNHLTNVWYIPEIGRNLFSMGQTTDKSFNLELDRKGCYFKKEGRVRLIGRMVCCEPETPAEVFIASVTDTVELWHERLCHQSKQHVARFLKHRGVDVQADEEFCEGCVYGKQHRANFKSQKDRSSVAGELIHADVNGPMEEKSIGGARYYVCFKDEELNSKVSV
jgi:hypothetical protein